ncbi:hypothetical protein DPEC_G00034220, partial [Dallia pectoralis]
MGLDCVDVLKALLERDMKHILTRILRVLGDVDLVRCRKVSRSWEEIICQDKSAFRRCRQAEQRIMDSRTPAGQDNVESLTRNSLTSRVVMSSIQRVASTPAQKSTRRVPSQRECTKTPHSSGQSRFREYQKVASSLKQCESLKPCKRCGSPAKHNVDAMRA